MRRLWLPLLCLVPACIAPEGAKEKKAHSEPAHSDDDVDPEDELAPGTTAAAQPAKAVPAPAEPAKPAKVELAQPAKPEPVAAKDPRNEPVNDPDASFLTSFQTARWSFVQMAQGDGPLQEAKGNQVYVYGTDGMLRVENSANQMRYALIKQGDRHRLLFCEVSESACTLDNKRNPDPMWVTIDGDEMMQTRVTAGGATRVRGRFTKAPATP